MQDKRERTKRAYQPQRPFKTVEGIGTLPFDRLSPHATWVLAKFYAQFTGFNRSNLALPYREVKPIMSSLLFSRAVWQLIGYGFIDVKRFGRLERNCSIYGLSNRWRGLTDDPARCDRIQSMLDEVEKLKRQPGSTEKRARLWELRKKILKA